MNYRNKISLLAVALSLMSSIGLAQTEREEGGRMQYGVKVGAAGFWYQTHTCYDASAGWRFNEIRYLGLGTGLHRVAIYDDADPDNENGVVPSIPLYVDYIHYTPFRHHRQHSFYCGLEAGGGIYLDKLPLKDSTSRLYPYLNGKIGLDFAISNRVGFNFGLNLLLSDASGLGVAAGLRF